MKDGTEFDLDVWNAQDVELDTNKDTDDFLGACPECKPGSSKQLCNIYKEHWCYCETHKIKWCIGYNLFSSWQFETQDEWNINELNLKEYKTK